MPTVDENFVKRIQPHSEEAERSVLGSMLMDRDAIVEAEDILTKEDFYQRQYGIVFEAMVELYREGKAVDLITLQNKLKEKDNVIIKTNAYIEKLMGEERLSGIVLNNGDKVELDGIFLAIGMMPDTKILKDTGTLDKNGYVIAGEDCITSADGLFVAGDARTKKLRQVVTAVADGAAAVSSVLEYVR